MDEELEIPDEEAVFSDPEDDDEIEAIKAEPIEKEYHFKPIDAGHTGGSMSTTAGEERESNEDITELEELENIGEELKELLVQFFRER